MGASVLPVIGGLAEGIGGALGQSSAQDAARRNLQLQLQLQRLLGLGGLAGQQAGTANQIGNQMQTAPLRDQAAYALAGRLGVSPTAFQPRDLFNGGSPSSDQQGQRGGIDLNALAQRQQGYTPGAGGISGDQSLQQAILGQLGYGRQAGNGTAGQIAAGGQYGYSQPQSWTAGQPPVDPDHVELIRRLNGGG